MSLLGALLFMNCFLSLLESDEMREEKLNANLNYINKVITESGSNQPSLEPFAIDMDTTLEFIHNHKEKKIDGFVAIQLYSHVAVDDCFRCCPDLRTPFKSVHVWSGRPV